MADISQRVVFSAIPDGVDGKKAFLNIHVAPRLSLTNNIQPQDLTQFPAWSQWARIINSATITVLANGQVVASERRSTARQDIWAALFPETLRVQAHEFQDLRGVDVLTYPMAELADIIEKTYVRQAGEEGSVLPTTNDLGKLVAFQPSRDLKDKRAAINLLNNTDSAKALSNPSVAIGLLAAYHQPLEPQQTMVAKPDSDTDGHLDAEFESATRVDLPSEEELAKQFDFHKIVAAVGQHPALMRACGLVVPLVLRRSDLPEGDVVIEVKVEWDTGGVETEADIAPRTQARHTKEDFRARPRDPGLLRGGWLRMDPDTFRLVTMDVDGAGLSLKNFAINLPSIKEERYDDEEFAEKREARVGMPRIRSVGLQLAQTRRDRALKKLFEGSGKLNDDASATGTTDVFAEDLIRGWRADIVDEKTERWQSLLRFDGRYDLVNSGDLVETEDEETTLKIAASKAADGSNPDLLKTSEAMFAWAGWSLAAPQPGRAIMPDDKAHEDAPNTLPDGLPLQVTPRARAGSLPLLRFGRTYRARMRYADLAGSGIGWRQDGSGIDGTETRPYFFGRYEPVEAPALTLIDDDPLPKDGESMARAALRTRDNPADNDVTARRNVVPAQVGVRFAELHGVLDKHGRPDPDRYSLLTGRDNHYAEVGVPGLRFDPANPAVPVEERTSFATGPARSLTPYLCDPLAAGAALRISGVPGINPEKIWSAPFYGDVWDADAAPNWPDAEGFSLLAVEDGVTGWDAATRTFTVALKPAERARIELSALVPKRGIALFKLLERLKDRAETGSASDVERYQRARTLIGRGRHWMFTPWRKVELVHAVQRPLIKPDFLTLSANRSREDVTARLLYSTPIHCKSTVRIDTDAQWLEIDDKGEDGPVIRSFASDAFNRKFARLDWPQNVAKRLFDDHVFDDTRARYVGYRMRATTRFREFMPLEVRADPSAIDNMGEPKQSWVPASSPPAAPVILYVVPTFGWWESGDPEGEQRSWREGGGLRVYLDRPWFSSGSNEMLAVLLPQVADVGPNDPLRDFVTQWGGDPIWAGPKVKTVAPKRTAFPKRIDNGPVPYDFGEAGGPPVVPDGAAAGDAFPLTGLTPQGAPDTVTTEAVPHAVGYDRARKLWYCDIVINPGTAYFPFVRLALARYQPHAISGCELSSVAMTSFQQLSADRVAVVTPAGGPLGRVRKVSIYGRLPATGYSLPNAGNISIRLQRLKVGGDEDLDWRDTEPGVPPPIGPGINVDVDLGSALARTRSAFHIARTDLSANQRQLLRAGSALTDAQIGAQVQNFPGIFELLLPPLMHEQTILLPDHGGDRLRLLITESERYRTEGETGLPTITPVERVVYAATMEV